jgi:short-subunit dehydrogenase
MSLPPQRTGGSVLVTGASSGIGEQFALQLADLGYDLILVARREDRLRALAGQISSKGSRAEVLATDLSDPDAVQALPLRVAELGLEVDILVNNAGFGTAHRPFAETPFESQTGQIRVNCEALVALSHAFLPAMLERRSGAIINVASTAGMQPLPYEAVYSASKAFALNFSDALHMEVAAAGVEVLAVNPGPVPTEWQEVAGLNGMPKGLPEISAEQVARESIEAARKGKRSIIPGRGMRFAMAVTAPSPRALKLRVMERANRPGSKMRYR